MQKLVLVFLAALAAPAAATEVSPIGKIIQMIGDLQSKVIAEGEESQKLYAEFAEWCEDRSKDLGFEIKTGKAEVETLKATIDEETALTLSLNTKIEELASSIASDDADLKAATKVRETENADFVAEEKELMTVIDMISRASGIIEREMAKSGAAFLQGDSANNVVSALAVMVQASLIDSSDASKLTAFVQSSNEDEETGAPAAAAYEGHSGGILDTLDNLKEKAEAQLAEARKKEETSLHNFDMPKQSLTDEIEFATKDMEKAKTELSASAEKKATAEGDLEVTSKDLAEDIKAKGELHQECMTKATDFEMETKSRGEELTALATAKKVIEEATGGAEGQVYDSAASFVQLTAGASLKNRQVVRIVRDLARKNRAPALAQLASRLENAMHSGSKDVFGKIKGLITDMIAKLEEEAAADAEHDAYCQKEMKETETKKADKEAEVKKLTTKIDQQTADSAQLKEEVAELQATVAALQKSEAEGAKLRAEEKAAYTKNKAELEQGVEGVKKALKVLTDYYAKADKAHGASSGSSEGIIGLLEVCESDFSKELAEVVSTEESAAAAFETQSKENELELTTKSQDIKYKTKESKELDKSSTEIASDLSTVQEELDAVLEYYSKIKGECVAKAEPYEEIVARRTAEIAGLKEALEILESETALVQTSSRTLRGTKKH